MWRSEALRLTAVSSSVSILSPLPSMITNDYTISVVVKIVRLAGFRGAGGGGARVDGGAEGLDAVESGRLGFGSVQRVEQGIGGFGGDAIGVFVDIGLTVAHSVGAGSFGGLGADVVGEIAECGSAVLLFEGGVLVGIVEVGLVVFIGHVADVE